MGISSLRAKGLIYLQNPRVKQALMLFSVNLATLPIGIITSVVLSRYLGANGYGDYQLLDNIFTLAVLIFIFGFFNAANRALVLNNSKEKARELYGATFVILIGLFLIMSVSLSIYALFDANLKEKHLSKLLLLSIPFGWVYLATNYFETLFQADNRINLLGLARLLPKLGYLITAAVIYWFYMHKSANHLQIAWGAYIAMQVIAASLVLFIIKLSFKNVRNSIREIWLYNKSYGFHVYTGSVFVVGVATLTGILISYFGKNNSGVGYYALAVSLSSPLQFIPNTIATTNYKEFSVQASIPPKLTRLTVMLTTFSLVALWLIVPPFVNHFYGQKFQPVIYLNFVVSIGIACYGMGDFYNRFLGSHGHGKLLRNTSFIVGTIILVFNLILIPLYGANGAAVTRLLGGVSYLLCILYYYNKQQIKA